MKKIYTGLLISLMTCSLTAQTFTEITGTPFDTISGPIAFADIDNDNDQDVIIGSRIYKNDGNGIFEYESIWDFMDGVTSIVFADIDSDNDLDVMISWYESYWQYEGGFNYYTSLFSNNGNGIFTQVQNTSFTPGSYGSINFADVDNDNDQDVFITGYTYYDGLMWGGGASYPQSTLYINDGNGSYTLSSSNPFIGIGGSDVAIADIDNDNDQDILITGNACLASAWCLEPLSNLYINDGNGSFTLDSINPFVSVGYSAVAFSDIDNDNDQDVIITGRIDFDEGTAKLYTNDGSGNFTNVTSTPFDGVDGKFTLADVNNDNDQDVLIISNSGNETIAKLYTNDGNGNFTEVTDTPFESVTGPIAFADIDNDYDQDVLIGWKITGQASTKLYLNNLSATANANTCYYGEQAIITDSVGPGIYHLVDTTRGGGIETYNLNYSWSFASSEWEHFVDDDNYWECENPIENKGAIDAHWSMEKIYDFYMEKYNRNSFDGNGAKMVTLVNLGNVWGLGFFSGIFAAFGGATGTNTPRTFIEHVGHEFAHGIVHCTAGLQYTDEIGALNESYCNILGTAIEFWAIPETASWLFANLDPTKYNMSDPNNSLSPVGTHYPDTYHGNYWLFGGSQQAIVHTNCAVQDYCFYLLSEGGSGSNDNGDDYNVDAIGIDKATDIFYRALTVYLTATSQFIDSRQATIHSAIDLYGECSNEVEQVINAWYAVGVGPDDYTNDLSLTSIISPANNCNLSAEEIVEVEVLYNFSGCGEIIPAGSSIGMTYQLDDEEAVIETWILAQDFVEGETKTYIFSQGISLPNIAVEHELSIYVDYASDDLIMNNLIDAYSIERKYEYDGNNLSFEDFGSNNDGFYIHTGSYAMAEIDPVAKNTGDYGFLMTVVPGKSGPSPIPNDPSLNFEQQKELISEICFCVDATDWEHVSLYFDLKQTHSMLYNFVYGSDSTEFLSSMRMLINGEQFGEQFHPETYFEDPFVTYNYDLSQLAGTYFEFCFQSKNYVDDAPNGPPVFTYESEGDNTFLDNILFADQVFTAVLESETSNITIYPNPANEKIYITSNKGTIISEINIFNQVGQKVLHDINPTNPLDISELRQGIYFIEVTSNKSRNVEKLIVQ